MRITKKIVATVSAIAVMCTIPSQQARSESLIPLGSTDHSVGLSSSLQGESSDKEESPISDDQLEKIGTPQWNSDIKKLEDRGSLKVIGHSESKLDETTKYQVSDPKTGDHLGDFTIVQPKTSTRIDGSFENGIPAVIFNQDDQKALKVGGMQAVSSMAAAWAAALAETVVGAVLSAGAIQFVGGVASYYVSKNGVCENNKNLRVDIYGQTRCE